MQFEADENHGKHGQGEEAVTEFMFGEVIRIRPTFDGAKDDFEGGATRNKCEDGEFRTRASHKRAEELWRSDTEATGKGRKRGGSYKQQR